MDESCDSDHRGAALAGIILTRLHIVLLESGDTPGHCGVGDYTRKLAEALSRASLRVSLLRAEQPLADLRRQVAHLQADGLSIQYPTRAYGWSLKPHLLAYTAPCPVYITLHEYAQAHPLRRLSLQFLARSKRAGFVFTSVAERSAFLSDGASQDCVYRKAIPIASNIPFAAGATTREANTVVHFGLLRPNRGLEAFLELVAIARRKNRNYRFRLIGAVPGSGFAYAQDRVAEAQALGVDVQLELNAGAVADLLAKSQFGYMPFPQGADVRRGSLLALLGNGVCTLTGTSVDSTPDLMSVVESVSGPEQALERLERLSGNAAACEGLSRGASVYAQQFRWDDIASRYLGLFHEKVRTENHSAGLSN